MYRTPRFEEIQVIYDGILNVFCLIAIKLKLRDERYAALLHKTITLLFHVAATYFGYKGSNSLDTMWEAVIELISTYWVQICPPCFSHPHGNNFKSDIQVRKYTINLLAEINSSS